MITRMVLTFEDREMSASADRALTLRSSTGCAHTCEPNGTLGSYSATEITPITELGSKEAKLASEPTSAPNFNAGCYSSTC